MRTKDPQLPTVIRPGQITPDVTYEPPLRVGFGLNDQTVTGARATMGRTILVPGAGPNPRHYHARIDVCWYIFCYIGVGNVQDAETVWLD